VIKEPRPMREIHKIQEELHERWKNMTDKEVIADIHQRAEKLIRQHNLKFAELKQ
jgi:hypothetical protein